MDFVYYIVRRSNNTIIDIADDMVGAIKKAQQMEGAYLIVQGCVITEIGEDAIEEPPENNEVVQPEVIDNDTEE
jgi:tRNA A37 methylthiotransferase MiaB